MLSLEINICRKIKTYLQNLPGVLSHAHRTILKCTIGGEGKILEKKKERISLRHAIGTIRLSNLLYTSV